MDTKKTITDDGEDNSDGVRFKSSTSEIRLESSEVLS